MEKRNVFFVIIFSSVFALSGCVVRTYRVTKDRVDQDLTTGNRGYLMGRAPKVTKERKMTRSTQVVEVEMHPPVRVDKKPIREREEKKPVTEQAVYTPSVTPYIPPVQGIEPETAPEAVSAPAAGQNFKQYTVEKNDTLQKISMKFFGTTKKWYKIYEANKQILKGPNKIYPGQVINIPVETVKEPQENLK